MSEWREAFCPVCMMAHGMMGIKDPDRQWVKLGEENFWERPRRCEHFGLIKSSEGRGTMAMVGYFEPEEDVDGYYPLVRERLLAAVDEWIANGWLEKADVQAIIDKH